MKDQLELKHLAPYLPYGLKYWRVMPWDKWNGKGETREWAAEMMINNISGVLTRKKWKPILRPLSDLTKEIEHNGEKFVPSKFGCNSLGEELSGLQEYLELTRSCSFTDRLALMKCSYEVIQKLFEWHFDVFGLIEKGLAIDMNTLNK